LSYGDWLAAPREKKFFEGGRLLFREIPGTSKRIQASYIDSEAYYGHSISPFIAHDSSKDNLLFILSIANSTITSWYGRLVFPNFSKDIFPKINPADISSIPIVSCMETERNELSSLADAQLAANEQLQKYTQKFLNRVQSTLGVAKVTEKLSEFYKYDFSVFQSELKKQKIKLSLREQDDWEEYFNGYRQDCTRLLLEIEENDRQIDKLVYDLYGLTDEEIAIVEGKSQNSPDEEI
ncbi:MAG: hypothetical protein J6A01_10485, partial [Proteobacteria bacterium]|nr:hypothetical protein [Pseudomonadota bacterium]